MSDEKEQKATTEPYVSRELIKTLQERAQHYEGMYRTQGETIQGLQEALQKSSGTFKMQQQTVVELTAALKAQAARVTAANAKPKKHKNTIIRSCFITAVIVGLCAFSFGARFGRADAANASSNAALSTTDASSASNSAPASCIDALTQADTAFTSFGAALSTAASGADVTTQLAALQSGVQTYKTAEAACLAGQ
jgi:hypothetical protein